MTMTMTNMLYIMLMLRRVCGKFYEVRIHPAAGCLLPHGCLISCLTEYYPVVGCFPRLIFAQGCRLISCNLYINLPLVKHDFSTSIWLIYILFCSYSGRLYTPLPKYTRINRMTRLTAVKLPVPSRPTSFICIYGTGTGMTVTVICP